MSSRLAWLCNWAGAIALLACAACGGSGEKDAVYPQAGAAGYPASAQAAGSSADAAPSMPGSPPVMAPQATTDAVSEERYSFEDDAPTAGDMRANDATTRAAGPPQPPPPPPAPPKPQTSATDKKIANVDIENATGDGAPSTSKGGPGGMTGGMTGGMAKTSTPASQDTAPHKSDFLIYTASMTMAVYQVEPGLAAVEQIGKDLGGYLAVRNDTSITIRVPRASFDEAIRRIGLTGDVVHKEVSAEDVTDQFVDMEARLRNAKAMRDRLQELLQRAAVKEAIEIQAQLGKVTEEIERLEGQLKLMRDKIAYSSIAVNFAARGSGALRDMPLRLPFPWLQELGLPRLMSLHE